VRDVSTRRRESEVRSPEPRDVVVRAFLMPFTRHHDQINGVAPETMVHCTTAFVAFQRRQGDAILSDRKYNMRLEDDVAKTSWLDVLVWPFYFRGEPRDPARNIEARQELTFRVTRFFYGGRTLLE